MNTIDLDVNAMYPQSHFTGHEYWSNCTHYIMHNVAYGYTLYKYNIGGEFYSTRIATEKTAIELFNTIKKNYLLPDFMLIDLQKKLFAEL